MDGTALTAEDLRGELEKLVWRLTEWRGAADVVDELLRGADRYAAARCREAGHRDALRLPLDAEVLLPAGRYEVGVAHPVITDGVIVSGELLEITLVEPSLTDRLPASDDLNAIEAKEASLERSRTALENSRTWKLPDGSALTRTWEAEKPCRRCGVEKPIDEFNFDRTCLDGHAGACRKCQKEQRQEITAGRPSGVKR